MKKINELPTDRKIRPLHDRVIVRVISDSDVTKGGIIMLDAVKDLPQVGEVVAVGRGLYKHGKLWPLDVKIGDRVLFHKYTGVHFWRGKEELLFMREYEILGKEQL